MTTPPPHPDQSAVYAAVGFALFVVFVFFVYSSARLQLIRKREKLAHAIKTEGKREGGGVAGIAVHPL